METAAATSTVAVTLLIASLGLKLTDVVKYLVNLGTGNVEDKRASKSGLLNFAIGWVLGVAVVWVLARTEWGDEITIGKEALANLSLGGMVIFGLVFTTVAATLYDFKKAIDNKDDAVQPQLVKLPGGRVEKAEV